jgi:hypothetical protein
VALAIQGIDHRRSSRFLSDDSYTVIAIGLRDPALAFRVMIVA